MIIKDINDYASYLGTTVHSLKRDVYKYTDCGAWIDWDSEKVTIGSIVEGSDAEFSKSFAFPVNIKYIDDWFNELERLTDEAWHEANDEQENYED